MIHLKSCNFMTTHTHAYHFRTDILMTIFLLWSTTNISNKEVTLWVCIKSESFLNKLPHNFFQSLQGILWLKLSGVLWMIIFCGSISLYPLSQFFVLNIESDLLHVNQNFFKANFLLLVLNQIFYMWTKTALYPFQYSP